MDEPQLPGVLLDLGGLVALTLARGNLSVVTDSAGSSRIRASMLAAASGVEKLAGRVMCFEMLLEKNRGDLAPSRCDLPMDPEPEPDAAGISNRLGGDLPVRGFFTEDDSML